MKPGHVIALLLGATGCDVVFSLDRPPVPLAPDGAEPYERCGPYLYDDPLRYAAVLSPNVDELGARPWSWSDARTACRQRGMDLAVLNDAHEASVSADLPTPFWIGASRSNATWTAVDGCPAMMPAESGADACAIVAPGSLISEASCDGPIAKTFEPPLETAVVIAAMCETPRPEAEACLGNVPTRETYAMSPTPLSFAAARAFCRDRGSRPVVFETHAEWLFVTAMVRDEMHERFWIGGTFDGTQWNSESSCPMSYAWAQGSPSRTPQRGDCVGAVLVESVDETLPPGTMVVAGTDVTSCEAPDMHALCEN